MKCLLLYLQTKKFGVTSQTDTANCYSLCQLILGERLGIQWTGQKIIMYLFIVHNKIEQNSIFFTYPFFFDGICPVNAITDMVTSEKAGRASEKPQEVTPFGSLFYEIGKRKFSCK